MPDPSSFLNADESKIEENLGLENPTGSKNISNQHRYNSFIERLYLNDGKGEAWAGHDNDRVNPEGFWYVSDFLALENLGAVPPTGSKKISDEVMIIMKQFFKI